MYNENRIATKLRFAKFGVVFVGIAYMFLIMSFIIDNGGGSLSDIHFIGSIIVRKYIFVYIAFAFLSIVVMQGISKGIVAFMINKEDRDKSTNLTNLSVSMGAGVSLVLIILNAFNILQMPFF